jgi:hypothetical protein
MWNEDERNEKANRTTGTFTRMEEDAMLVQPRCTGSIWVATAALAAALVLTTTACAPTAYSSRGQSVYSTTPYDRLQQRSQQLEMLAARARDGARLDQRRGGRHEVTDRMDDFAKHARDLRRLVHERDAPASKIDDRIRQLMDDGNEVQKEWANSGARNPQTLADWDHAVAALTDFNSQFAATRGLAVRPDAGVGVKDAIPDRPDGRAGGDGGEALLGDLDRRVNDALRLSERSWLDATANDVSRRIAEFRDGCRDFAAKAGRMDLDERRDRLDHLLKDAQATQRDLAQRRVSGELVDRWNGVVDLVVRLRNAS